MKGGKMELTEQEKELITILSDNIKNDSDDLWIDISVRELRILLAIIKRACSE